ncbi:MAG: biofilm PGA synthesis protein PgaB [Bacteroidales bacterium]|nr:biofilm PGA synthesis protein PgaB [Bacteroidales bacterium]
MKKPTILFFTLAIIFSACQKQKTNTENVIKVGVFDKNGDSPYCITDALESLKIDSDIEARTISASEIMSEKANDIDVFLFPGGSGRSETASLGELGQQKIIDLVKKQGKGIVGICAGAYILSETPGYPSLGLSGGEAIDIEHDHRGHGLVKFCITKEGEEFFPELKNFNVCYSQYYEGPVLIPAKNSKYKYTKLATMLSDVHTVEGSPANMTNNRPFIIVTNVEKGKTASVVGHPENTPGMRWIIPRLVRIVAKKTIVSYRKNVVRPEIYKEEILFTSNQLQKQQESYNNLLKSKEEKLDAMQNLVDMCAWSAKKHIPPMLRDRDFDVRLLAAKLTVYLERTDAINDLKAAVDNEKNRKNKNLLHEQLKNLETFLGKNK